MLKTGWAAPRLSVCADSREPLLPPARRSDAAKGLFSGKNVRPAEPPKPARKQPFGVRVPCPAIGDVLPLLHAAVLPGRSETDAEAALFAAIHERLEPTGRRPRAPARDGLVTDYLGCILDVDHPAYSPAHLRFFPAIARGQDGAYRIALPLDGEARGTGMEVRTREEVALHVLLETHFLLAARDSRNAAVAPAALFVQAPPVAPAVPVTAGIGDRRVQVYGPREIDAGAFEQKLQQTHVRRMVSAGSSNCWMRASWLSALLQCDPDVLEKTLRLKTAAPLDDRLQLRMQAALDEAGFPSSDRMIRQVVDTARELRRTGLERVWANGAFTPAAADRAIAGLSYRLLMSGLDAIIKANQANSRKDRSWGRSKVALLGDAWIDRKITELEEPTIGASQGYVDQIETLMNVLGGDAAILATGERSVTLSGPRDSVLHAAADRAAGSVPGRTNALHAATVEAGTCVVVHTGDGQGGHYEVYVPKTLASIHVDK